jgi:GxxExxY protein
MASGKYTSDDDPLTYRIIGCAIQVHRALGPGLVESVYEECLSRELTKAALPFEQQKRLGVNYDGDRLDRNYRSDFIVDGQVIVEVKSVRSIHSVHLAQALTYMKLADITRGLIINFNVAVLARGLRRLILTPEPPGNAIQ